MNKVRKYTSVTEMVRDLSEEKEFTEDFAKHVQERRLVKLLQALRATKGMSQKDIADCLDCSQSRISKLERGTDSDLRLSDVSQYLAALDIRLQLTLTHQPRTIVDEVKQHAFSIKRLLDKLAELAGGDERIAQGVSDFLGEALFNLIAMIQDSAQKLPACSDTGIQLCIDFEEPEESDPATSADRGIQSVQ